MIEIPYNCRMCRYGFSFQYGYSSRIICKAKTIHSHIQSKIHGQILAAMGKNNAGGDEGRK